MICAALPPAQHLYRGVFDILPGRYRRCTTSEAMARVRTLVDPHCPQSSRICATNLLLGSGLLSWNWNNGPCSPLLTARYPRIASIRQRGPSTLSTTTSTPNLNGSVLDCLRWIFSMLGDSNLSKATSLKLR